MSQIVHKVYIFSLVAINVVVFILMAIQGIDYYLTDVEQRFFHEQNEVLKPSGFIGHGAGILGSILLLTGVFGYMARKRIRAFSRLGGLKYWLEFHIFLCTLGPILILFHSAFKFGGIAAFSFWSMIVVIISGIIGRFFYLQIPRTIQGREVSLNELNIKKAEFNSKLQEKFTVDDDLVEFLNHTFGSEIGFYSSSSFIHVFKRFSYEKELINSIKSELNVRSFTKSDYKKILHFIHAEIVLNRKIAWYTTMRKYLKYWHIIHLPLALIMLINMAIHIVVAILFGYTWIF